MEKDYINWVEEKLGKLVSVSKEAYGDQSHVWCVNTLDKNYFLKIGKELVKEKERLDWLDGRLPIPKVIDFTQINEKDLLLLSAVEGINLAELCKKWSKEQIVDKLAEALLKFHSTETKDCPFGNNTNGKVLVHGDACLPNFIFKEDVFSGYIDLGDLRVDNVEVDLSAAVWSLQYNIGAGYGLKFLQKYGIKDATEELVEKLRLQYEETQKAWGLI